MVSVLLGFHCIQYSLYVFTIKPLHIADVALSELPNTLM